MTVNIKQHPMKHTLQLLSLGFVMAALSGCDTYIEGRGRAHSHAYPYRYGPGYNHTQTNHYYYDRRPSPRPSGPVLNANTNLGLRL